MCSATRGPETTRDPETHAIQKPHAPLPVPATEPNGRVRTLKRQEASETIMRRATLTLSTLTAVSFLLMSIATGTSAQSFSTDALVQAPTDGWRTNGGNLYNQNYSPLDQINRENVAGLKGVWQTRLRGSGSGPRYSGEAQPIVHDGVIYMITGADDVFALSVETGAILWS